MLHSLSIRDLAVVGRVDLTIGTGLTVITGETGAGKSILVDAMALLGGDLNSLQPQLETAFRMPYSLDRGNSNLERFRASEQA